MATPRKSTMTVEIDLEEAIRRGAYEIYEQLGRIDGHAEEDWQRSRSEIMCQFATSAAA